MSCGSRSAVTVPRKGIRPRQNSAAGGAAGAAGGPLPIEDGFGWDGFGEYMRLKRQKLDGQFADGEEFDLQKVSDIFRGVRIYVDGHTTPPAHELKRIIRAHGGEFDLYHRSKGSITHVIATNLPDTKLKQNTYARVVHPDWLLESIRAGRQLPWAEFALGASRVRTQRALPFAARRDQAPHDVSCTSGSEAVRVGENPGCVRGGCEGNHSDGVDAHVTGGGKATDESPDRDGDAAHVRSRFSDHRESTAATNYASVPFGVLYDEEGDGEITSILSPASAFGLLEDARASSDEEPQQRALGNEDACAAQMAARVAERSSGDACDPPIPDTADVPARCDAVVQPIGSLGIIGENGTPATSKSCLSRASDGRGHLGGIGGIVNYYKRTAPARDDDAVHHEVELPGSPETYDSSRMDGDFVASYYRTSRLHYLSTWGAEVKRWTAEMLASRPPSPPVPTDERPGERIVVHVDMDSFFVSCSLVDRPDLAGKPVAVAHSTRAGATANPQEHAQHGKDGNMATVAGLGGVHSTSEIASCNYVARSFGIHNGSYVGESLRKCPGLIVLPYDFDRYKRASWAFYEAVLRCSRTVQAVSCDEAYIELTRIPAGESAESLIAALRRDIAAATGGLTASAGIASNMLLARMCTRVAKPNGQLRLAAGSPSAVMAFLAEKQVSDLPGVGWSAAKRLRGIGVDSCADLALVAVETLQAEFGPKMGKTLHDACRGIDDRPLQSSRERKSVSVEISWGVRFTDQNKVEWFLGELAHELSTRMRELDVVGSTLSLKVLSRKEGVNVVHKYMGCGPCDALSRTARLDAPTADPGEIAAHLTPLLRAMDVPPVKVRGMGIHVTRLAPASGRPRTMERGATKGPVSVRDMLLSRRGDNNAVAGHSSHSAPSGNLQLRTIQTEVPPDAVARVTPHGTACARVGDRKGKGRAVEGGETEPEPRGTVGAWEKTLPPPSQIDLAVYQSLPDDVRSELRRAYADDGTHLMLASPPVAREAADGMSLDGLCDADRTHGESSAVAGVWIGCRGGFEGMGGSATDSAVRGLAFVEDGNCTLDARDLLASPGAWDPTVADALPPDILGELRDEHYRRRALVSGGGATREASHMKAAALEDARWTHGSRSLDMPVADKQTNPSDREDWDGRADRSLRPACCGNMQSVAAAALTQVAVPAAGFPLASFGGCTHVTAICDRVSAWVAASEASAVRDQDAAEFLSFIEAAFSPSMMAPDVALAALETLRLRCASDDGWRAIFNEMLACAQGLSVVSLGGRLPLTPLVSLSRRAQPDKSK